MEALATPSHVVLEWLKANPWILLPAGVVALATFPPLFKRLGVHAGYFVMLLGALGWALTTDRMLYYYAFLLGVAAAFAEIIGKFSDEPIKALRTVHALVYHLVNGLAAMLALKFLLVAGVAQATEFDRIKLVMAAGLGSMLVMRSKLFNMKVAGEDVSFGPEQIVRVFFRFMEDAIDRVRAQSRIDFVTDTMRNIDFDQVYDYSLTMLNAPLALAEKERGELTSSMEKIKNNARTKQLKAYELGYVLLNKMGEDFVAKLYKRGNAPAEWLFQAPMPDAKEGSAAGLLAKIPFLAPEKEPALQYFAYGSSMASERFRGRLKWDDPTKFLEVTKPRNAVLKGYALAFNAPMKGEPGCGRANVVADAGSQVEGVVYELPMKALEFLKQSESGAKAITVKVSEDGNDLEAIAFVAETPRDELQPSKRYVDAVLAGAREHKLTSEYIHRLEGFKASAMDTAEIRVAAAARPELPPAGGLPRVSTN